MWILKPDLLNLKFPVPSQPIYIMLNDANNNGEKNKCVDEILYATGVDTFNLSVGEHDSVFYLAGRSTFMDQTFKRFSLTECPPPT